VLDLDFTVIMPVHNEEEFISYSLPSIYSLKPNELLVLLDRCTDDSESIIKNISKKSETCCITRIIESNEATPDWNRRSSYLRRKGFHLAKNDVILNTDADIILDPKISSHLANIGLNGLGLIGFGFIDYPYNVQSFLRMTVSQLTPFSGYAGLYAFSKKAWLKTEDPEMVKRLLRSEDTYLRKSIAETYRIRHINTRSLHLRPDETRERDFFRGEAHWDLLHFPIWLMFLYSMVTLRPASISGYINARYRKNTRKN
jgi:glycosyltransferase involved in cell wall biosynthesis